MERITGFLITASDSAREDHGLSGSFFTRCRGLREALRVQAGGFCMSAFSPGETDGEASPEGPWVLGTLVYRGMSGPRAVARFREDLRGNDLEDLMEACDGQFCMVVGHEEGFSVVTDPAGIMHLYRYRSGNTLALSSSSMALSRHYPVTPNPGAIAQFLRCGNVYGSGTVYREITVLEPATLYSFTRTPAGLRETGKTYWRPPQSICEGMSIEESRDRLAGTMLQCFGALPREGLICDLTAGFDSRLVLSILSSFSPFEDIHTFVFGPPWSREVGLVRDYCRSLGMVMDHLALPEDWDHMIVEYVHRSLDVTDGEENVFVYAPILRAQDHKAMASSFSVNGLGGELYRDFWWIQELFPGKRPANLDRLIEMRVLQYEYDHSVFSGQWAGRMKGVRDILRHEFQSSIGDLRAAETYNTLQIDTLYLRQKLHRWAGRTISSSNGVISTITPLAMKRCLETVMVIPPGHKRNGRLVKAVIEKLSPRLSELTMLNGAPCRNLTLRNAHRFLPLLGDYGKRGVRKLVQKAVGRTILADVPKGYGQADFYQALLGQDSFREDFRYDRLRTGVLYHRDAYERLVEGCASGRSPFCSELGSILTLEMRMRGDNVRDDPA
ncbi:MAG TPA: hypothetical protein PK213_16080 [Deltaproteobacteria bacterium]|jgi:asparagine synthetase B (glutamine-hydrolysing)|nr:hypothetical protein [Deltaproteobacteria bacterium]